MSTEQTEINPCCVTGHLHEGTPLGAMSPLHGINTYISKPTKSNGVANGKIDRMILISDVFGVYPNAKLLADEWAGQGYEVLAPEFVDPIPTDMLNTIVPNTRVKAAATMFSKATDTAKTAAAIGPFLVSHREAVIKPKIEAFVQAVRADSTTRHLGAIGFCWGARYAFILAQETSPARVDAVIANHPSFLVAADVEGIKTVPCAIFKGTDDDIMSDKDLDEIEGIMKGNLGDKLFVKRYPGAVHGFTIRGDTEGPEKQTKDDANNLAMKFIKDAFATTNDQGSTLGTQSTGASTGQVPVLGNVV